ncbi:MAG: Gfo/Idh/MocA family oxidoreductase [Flavobacteriaceae bacterium]|jgi:predicted dehydrogenase|nr:Gfo/Idh/MocA family oxidoreductase [Flavobacteriaceae bacterium]MBT6654988.1 Gfo/Idh/MocA family oxidoreductase [Flavobacteriaceae bacterium]MBT7574219.1 Gfo/Idh/MocA family oxidoreductase [Flavobacteriaceae bacterium]MDB4601988.1 Gfo/Idh/MocA family oxidoreductase [Flavobacteriaceae bacterium]MDB9847394.1 Gfo/Idh/MocA family oxidoreductase [Flavobacteriaceae bacterium]
MKRRNFIKKVSATSTITFLAPSILPSGVYGRTKANNKINIGQIGCGRIARFHDMPGIMQYDNARLIAVCDVDINRMKDAKKLVENYYYNKTGSNNAVDVKMYNDYKELLQNRDIDAVVISTPDHWHAQPAIEAALAGKDIYLQKPTSLTVEEGRILSDIIQKKGTILQVGTQQRSMSQFRIAAELVRNGRIGKLHTVKIGLPGDPSGPETIKMEVPSNLNYDMWLGQTPLMDYTETGVHPKKGYSRPGWLRIEQFGAGMISGWGQHHYDSAAWGMDTELIGPVSVEAIAEFPKSGLWNVHGDFMSRAQYENGVTMYTSSGGYTNGIKYIGTDGWIFVSRGSYTASASDPVATNKNSKALDASDPKILSSVIGPDEIQLYKSYEHHGNWLDCIKTKTPPISTVEMGHRACSICLITHISMKLNRKLNWNPKTEKFINDVEANKMLARSQRKPFGVDYIKNF